MPMLDTVTIPVSDFGRSRRFYRAALEPLGYELLAEFPDRLHGGPAAGFGTERPEFWIREDPDVEGQLQIGFSAPTPAAVDAFHKAALAAGAVDQEAPGPVPSASSGRYAATVIDPDGHVVEAVSSGGETLGLTDLTAENDS